MTHRLELYYDGAQFDWFQSQAEQLFTIIKGDKVRLMNGRILEVSERIHTYIGSDRHVLQIHLINAPADDKADE